MQQYFFAHSSSECEIDKQYFAHRDKQKTKKPPPRDSVYNLVLYHRQPSGKCILQLTYDKPK